MSEAVGIASGSPPAFWSASKRIRPNIGSGAPNGFRFSVIMSSFKWGLFLAEVDSYGLGETASKEARAEADLHVAVADDGVGDVAEGLDFPLAGRGVRDLQVLDRHGGRERLPRRARRIHGEELDRALADAGDRERVDDVEGFGVVEVLAPLVAGLRHVDDVL